MFGKKSEGGTVSSPTYPIPTQNAPTSAPPAAAAPGGRKSTYLGPDLTIVGNLECNGLVQIEGTIEGDVHARQIAVGPKARLTGNIVADDVTVAGEVSGSVKGLNVTLKSGARIGGDIHHKSLAIEHGATFEGNSRRPQDVTELAPKLNTGKRS
jgi:cytoskeletal protein CcmA (bactofilin family)